MVRFAVASVVVAALFAGCGGGGSGGGSDASTDHSMPPTDTGADKVEMDQIVPTDAPEDTKPHHDGPLPGHVCKGLTGIMCESCCGMNFRHGKEVLDKALLGCACTAELCGPVSSGGADGGLEGTGACTDECPPISKKAVLPECFRCLESTKGTPMSPGPCMSTAMKACSADEDCKEFDKCHRTCLGI